jgi:peptide/nickel transport system substrate-binding protein
MRKMIGMAVAAAAIGLMSSAYAADLTIGMSAEPNSMDPHYHNLSPNNMMSAAVFSKLVEQDEAQNKVPGLAESWDQLAPNVWEFKLRKGVKWHDGSPFTAADVKFTLGRAGDVPNSPSSFGLFTKILTEVEVVDDHTVFLKTKGPFPLMPDYMSVIYIVSKKYGDGATTNDYNSGKAMIGTGPYKFVEWVPGDRLVYAKNPDYFGDKPEWDKVTVKPITNDSSRVAALLAGDVDFIDNPATTDIGALKKNSKIALAEIPSNRMIYLHLDSNRDKSPFVTDAAGKPMDKNPLKDVRVRRALSLAIDRKGIAEKVMEDLASPAGQLMPSNVYATVRDLKPDPYDATKAKALLAEAGYPNGFGLTIHGPNNRYVNDHKISQAIAQMLTRVGIKTAVVTMPSNVFFQKASALEYSLMLVGWSSGTGEPSNPIRALLQTYNKETKSGATNRGRYSNPALDETIMKAINAPTRKQWATLTEEATKIAMNDLGIIPLHFQVNVWAMRKELTYAARADEYTLIQSIHSAKK